MEYDKIIGAKSYDQLQGDGYIKTDKTILDFCKQHFNK